MPIRIVLAEDHYLVREGTRRLLETSPEVTVVATCQDLDSLLAAVDAEQPDVVVTDIRMPPTSTDEGIRAAELLRETHPDVGRQFFSTWPTTAHVDRRLPAESELEEDRCSGAP